jgi:hypothetical protein
MDHLDAEVCRLCGDLAKAPDLTSTLTVLAQSVTKIMGVKGCTIRLLDALACQGAIAIENARLFEHIKNEYKDFARDVWKWYDWGERFPTL